MALEKQDLAVGTRLVGRYKKETYRADVVHAEEGVRYRLEDGREFGSLSAAGSAVMGGVACNGWRFWSLDGEAVETAPAEREATETAPAEVKAEKPKRSNGILKRVPNQKGVPEGQVRYFCAACLHSFYASAGETPTACPEGHDDSFGEIQTEVEEAQAQEAPVE